MGIFARVVIAILGVLAVFAAAPSAHAQAALEPGLWRVTVSSTTNGKPDPNQDTKECLGEELKDITAYFAPQLEGGKRNARARGSHRRTPRSWPTAYNALARASRSMP